MRMDLDLDQLLSPVDNLFSSTFSALGSITLLLTVGLFFLGKRWRA